MIPGHARTSVVLLLLFLAAVLHAQLVIPAKGQTLPAFEVATVKPSSSALGRSFHVHIWWSDNSYSTQNTTLRDLIRAAFNTGSEAQITGGPGALLDARFDISAKIGDDDYAAMRKLPRDENSRQLHLMLQALLIDRFGLRYHVETRDLPVFDLVVDKAGSKLLPFPDQPATPALPTSSPSTANPPGSSPPPPPSSSPSVSTRIGSRDASITAIGSTLEPLTTILSRQPELEGRLILDKTGLTGKYNWTLQWSPQRLTADAPRAKPVSDPDSAGPSLFAALKEQLGLKLKPSRGSVPVVVIDAVSAPTPN